MNGLDSLASMPPTLKTALAVLIVVQLVLQVAALVDLARRKRVLGDRKWVWALVIVLGEAIGPVVYLAVGRNVPPEAADPLASGASSGRDRAEKAADVLYGKR